MGEGGASGYAGRMCRLFASVFKIYCTFVSVFSIQQCLFGSILLLFAYFWLYIMCISSRSQTVFWAQNFRDVQLIPNFFKISNLSLILQFLEGILGKTLPNRWILTQQLYFNKICIKKAVV